MCCGGAGGPSNRYIVSDGAYYVCAKHLYVTGAMLLCPGALLALMPTAAGERDFGSISNLGFLLKPPI